MAKTIHDRLVEALTAAGEKTVPNSRTQKYTVMTRASGGFWFIGRAGALRTGQNATSSIPSDGMKRRLLASEDAAMKKAAPKKDVQKYPLLRCPQCGYEYRPTMNAFRTTDKTKCIGRDAIEDGSVSKMHSFNHPFVVVDEE